MAVIFGKRLQCGGHHGVPAFGGSDGIQIAKRAFGSPILNIKTQHLHGGRRVACGDAGAQGGHCGFAAATSHRHIQPADILRRQIILKDVQRRRLSARGPPMQHLDIFGIGD